MGRSGGYALVWVLVISGLLLLVGGTVSAVARFETTRSLQGGDESAALAVAEVGFRKALALLEVAPLWRTAQGSPLAGTVPMGSNLTGSYEVQVRDTGEKAQGLYPLVEVQAKGRVRQRERSLHGRVYVEPPRFLRSALSLYGGFTGRSGSQLDAWGDVYVSGDFRARGMKGCVRGDLIARFPEGRPGPGDCRGSGLDVTGQVRELDSSTFRDRPIPPADWYRWAQRRLWQDIYRTSVPTPPASFSQMLARAADPRYPFGVMYVVEGDLVLSDGGSSSGSGSGSDEKKGSGGSGQSQGGSSEGPCQDRRGSSLTVQGRLTVVVTGTLTLDVHRMRYADPARDHLAFIALRGVRFTTRSIGPASFLLYTYNPSDPRTGGEVSRDPATAFNLSLCGTLAARVLTNEGDYLAIQEDAGKLVASPAPGIPGMRAVVSEWVLGAPEGDLTRERWGVE